MISSPRGFEEDSKMLGKSSDRGHGGQGSLPPGRAKVLCRHGNPASVRTCRLWLAVNTGQFETLRLEDTHTSARCQAWGCSHYFQGGHVPIPAVSASARHLIGKALLR